MIDENSFGRAALFAPLAAPVIAMLFTAFYGFEYVGLVFFFGTVISYLFFLAIGIPILFGLRALGSFTARKIILSGTIAGFLLGVATQIAHVTSGSEELATRLFVSLMPAVYGFSVSGFFVFLARKPSQSA